MRLNQVNVVCIAIYATSLWRTLSTQRLYDNSHYALAILPDDSETSRNGGETISFSEKQKDILASYGYIPIWLLQIVAYGCLITCKKKSKFEPHVVIRGFFVKFDHSQRCN